ncbi:MAG TPA: LamG-like jellyroll fold domain-containing protein [Chitinophagaceae bacterium]|nr:LamG-like jellyroll fold domain-containing protein [Chitinophagaceae bacterium]
MKKYTNYLLACIAILLSYSAIANGPTYARAEIENQEIDVNGVIRGNIILYAMDSIQVNQQATTQGPKDWRITIYLPQQTLFPGQSAVIPFTLEYPVNNLPFFPEEIVIEFPVSKYLDANKSMQVVRATGKVYFTPYQTVELISVGAYENMLRTWHTVDSGIPVIRKDIPRDQIPVSDLNFEKDTADGQDMDSIEVRYIRIEGLPYDIPMKVDRSQIPDGWEDDGPDSIESRIAGNTGNYDARHLRFTGRVRGRLTSVITNDVGMVRVIPLSGIHIKLKERDAFFDEDFGEMHTDANGFFDFWYDERQSHMEGNRIELYLIIQSKNKNHDIKAKRHGVFGAAYDQIRELGSIGTNGGLINGNMVTGIRAFRTVNWAVRSWEYCENVGGHALHNDLTILPHANSSRFLADGFLGISAPFTKPTIYLREQDCDQEATTYHEFGHFLMWNIQNRNFITVYSDPSQQGHFWQRENTPELAWSEGWAAAHQMIMDAAHWWEDQEYGFDETFRYTDFGPLYENRLNWFLVNNGIWAENYIGSAIYDLWDGDPDIPEFVQTALFGFVRVGSDDAATWTTRDNVRWDYLWILHPIAWTGGSSGKFKNIEEYFYWFRDHVVGGVDCQGRADVARVFRENMVIMDINDFNTNRPAIATTLSGDDLYIEQTRGYFAQFLGMVTARTVTHRINPPNNYFQTQSRTIDMNFGSNVMNVINENLFVTGAAGVANSRIRINPSSAITNGTVTTCNNPWLTFTFSNFELGGASNRARMEISGISLWQFNNGSNLILNPNSVFVVRAGSTLHIRNGSTVNLAAGTQILVENGGYICIEAGSNIVQTPGTLGFTLQAGAIQGVNPALGIAAGGCLAPPPPPPAPVPNEALQFDGVNDFVDIPNNNGGFNVGAGNFTMEAWVRLNPTPGLQLILSNRTFVNGGTADGFMFAVWGTGANGQPFVQLAGTPNIQPVAPTINLMDGNCHHVAVTRNGTVISFYVDGQFVANGTANSANNINSPGTMRMGADRLTPSPLNGWIGEVRFWNVARTPAQIAASFNANLTLPAFGLVSYYDMRDPNGQTLGDVSGGININNGTLGSNATAEAQDPVWLTPAQVTCNVGGNFRMITGNTQIPYRPDSSGISKQIAPSKHSEDKLYIAARVSVQPNPAASAFTLQLPARYKQVEIEVLNSAGAVVERRRLKQNETNLRFGQTLQPGFYVLKVKSSEGTETFKLVKQ